MVPTWHVTRGYIPEVVVEGKRLGRHYGYDSRSAAYPYAWDVAMVSQPQLWPRHIPILNQGNVGACTGNAEEGALGTDPLFPALPTTTQNSLGEAGALQLYSAAETIDGDGPYPPNDNGSTGTSVNQAAKNAGFISGYTHAGSVVAMEAALQAGPVVIGINWYDSFDKPNSSGLISISPSAQVRGGHEVLVRGVDPSAQLFHADNSWGPSWGLAGSMSFTYATMGRLFSEQGDCTVPLPLSAPAPAPIPVPADVDAAFWQQVFPWANQVRSRPDLVTLRSQILAWGQSRGYYGG